MTHVPSFLGKFLCWVGFHKRGRERTCAIVDRNRRRYVWCVQICCSRCKERLELRKTGTETRIPKNR